MMHKCFAALRKTLGHIGIRNRNKCDGIIDYVAKIVRARSLRKSHIHVMDQE